MKQLLELKIWTKGKEHNSFVKPDAWTKIRTGKKKTQTSKKTHTKKNTSKPTDGQKELPAMMSFCT